MAMPGRMLTEDVPLWQPLVAIALLLVATVLIVRLGARLYERTLLQTGRRTRLPRGTDAQGVLTADYLSSQPGKRYRHSARL